MPKHRGTTLINIYMFFVLYFLQCNKLIIYSDFRYHYIQSHSNTIVPQYLEQGSYILHNFKQALEPPAQRYWVIIVCFVPTTIPIGLGYKHFHFTTLRPLHHTRLYVVSRSYSIIILCIDKLNVRL